MSELKVYEEMEDYVGYDDYTPTEMYDKSEADKVIAELKAENERLNKELTEWIQNAANRPIVIGKLRYELRATNRALWLARAERAVAAQSVHEWCRYNEKHPCGLWRADPFECWVQAWICVEKLCRKKAKEYK